MISPTGNVRFDDIVLTNAIKRIEETGPLEDGQEASAAAALRTTREGMLVARAVLLARRLGLVDELERWRQASPAAIAILVALIALAAYGLTTGLVGDNRKISAMEAFLATLGINLLALAAWCISLLWPATWRSPVPAFFSTGNVLLVLVRRLGSGGNSHAAPLMRGLLDTLGRARLFPWLFGMIGHGIWAAAYALVSVGVYYLFYVRQYWLVWETTIQGKDAFAAFVDTTGWLPARLGFPMPDTALLPAQAGLLPDQHAWAWWIIGCVVVYGFLLRLILAALCWLVWHRRRKALGIDTADPYFRKQLARIETLETSHVIDPELHPVPASGTPVLGGRTHDAAALALIGFELPPEYAWPPAALDLPSAIRENIAGSAQERRRVLSALAAALPGKLLIVCHAASSPDRGTARFIGDACQYAGRCALLLVSVSSTPDAADQRRWDTWLRDAVGSKPLLFRDTDAAADWCRASDV